MAEEKGNETQEPEPEKSELDTKYVKIIEEQKAQEMIDRANTAAERLENANKELGVLLTKQEILKVENTLGGSASAGTKEKTEEEIEIESAKKLLAGTGLEDDIFPEPKD